jgi:hypothetical protein
MGKLHPLRPVSVCLQGIMKMEDNDLCIYRMLYKVILTIYSESMFEIVFEK